MLAASPVRSWSAAWRSAPVLDGALAAVMAAAGEALLVTGAIDEGPLAVTAPSYAAMSTALLLRRKRPLAMAVIVAVAWTAQSLLAVPPTSIWALALILIVSYSVGAHAPLGPAVAGGVLLIAATEVGTWLTAGAPLGDRLFTAPLLCGGPWAAGLVVRRYWAQARTLDVLNRELEQRRIEDVRTATAEERTRIARELHDVVAHSISVMVIQANAAAQLLDVDPARSREPLDRIRQTGKAALVDMRRLLGVLRTDDEGLARTPQPGLSDLPDLVDAMRAAGLDVRLQLPDPRPQLAAGCDLAVYRIVQEALTNARKHAGRVAVTVEVEVELHGDQLAIRVRNAASRRRAGQGRGGGHGLIGMRERAAIFGGSVDAGPDGDGWRVEARLPLEPSDHR